MQPVRYIASLSLTQHVSNHTAKKGKAGSQHQYSHLQLEKEGVILETQGIPEHRLAGLFGLVHCDPYHFRHNMEKIAQYNPVRVVTGRSLYRILWKHCLMFNVKERSPFLRQTVCGERRYLRLCFSSLRNVLCHITGEVISITYSQAGSLASISSPCTTKVGGSGSGAIGCLQCGIAMVLVL